MRKYNLFIYFARRTHVKSNFVIVIDKFWKLSA